MAEEFFQALYTPMLYRKKKVKKFKEGFVKRVNQKLVLYDEKKVKIESIFNSKNLEDGLELEFEENYCEVLGKEILLAATEPPSVPTYSKPPLKRMGLTRSSGLKVTIKKKKEFPVIDCVEIRTRDDLTPPCQDLSTSASAAQFSKTTQKQPAANYCTKRLKLNDVVENVPKSKQELLELFMSSETLVSEASNIAKDSNSPKSLLEINATVPTFRDYDESASEEDYENSTKPIPNFVIPKPNKSPLSSGQKRFKPVGSRLPVLNSSRNSEPSSLLKGRVISTRSNRFNFSFHLPLNDNASRLIRDASIPDAFSDFTQYKSCLWECLTETINLELQSLRIKYEKVLQKSKSNLESAMRSKRIPLYSGVCLSDSQTLDFGSGKSKSNNVSVTIDNKEHHSQYSKDDIWIISDSAEMINCEYFRSFYYGPSGSNLELTSMSKNVNSFKPWMSRNDLFALKALNAHSEMMMLDMVDSELEHSALLKNLMGKSEGKCGNLLKPKFRQDFESLCKTYMEDFCLNEDQASVISIFCKSLCGEGKPIVLVHGVYGAGKSFVIAVLIIILSKATSKGYFEEAIKIVFASMTNVAVDRILLSLKELGFEDFIRIGSLKKIAKPILPFTAQAKNNDAKELQEMLRDDLSSEDLKHVEKAISQFQNLQSNERISNAFVIGITCLATNFEILEDIKCPIFILDECSQMTEPMALLPIVRFKSEFGLLVGDPKQLAPTLSCGFKKSDCEFGLERTLFERLAHIGYEPVLLGIQYRCHPRISAVSNALFYDKRLRDGISAEARGSLVTGLPPFVFCQVEGYDDKTSFGSYTNESESRLIVFIIKQMVGMEIPTSEIGVISLYKGQADIISHNLGSIGISAVQVATVDSFQGSEKRVIILSTVRSSNSVFLEEPRRVNVALTRAKHHLIVTATDGLVKSSQLWNRIRNLAGKDVFDIAKLAGLFATP